jgi:glyoxylase-like metal-dependent hydrolase (beta-lactamase superfamily II)
MRGWLEFQIEQNAPDKAQPIVVYCGTTQRSALAAEMLVKLGYTNVQNYRDGFFNWKRAGMPVVETDAAPDSFLYRRPQEVAPGVYSAIGATAPGTYENSGHNNNLSFVVGKKAVLVVNAGDNYLLAQALHDEIKRVTPLPVKWVVLENSQGHAMLGSNYWQEQGAKIIAHRDTARAIDASGAEALATMKARARDKAYRTALTKPDIVYDDKLDLDLGGRVAQVLHLGSSHSHGDTMVWFADDKLVIAGDTAFHVRMLPIFDGVNTAKWIATWDKFEALGAKTVIPGHGGPTDMATVRKWTRDYLVHLRSEVKKLIDAGGSLDDAYKIDQSAYLHLHTADELARSNAGRVFREMEFE